MRASCPAQSSAIKCNQVQSSEGDLREEENEGELPRERRGPRRRTQVPGSRPEAAGAERRDAEADGVGGALCWSGPRGGVGEQEGQRGGVNAEEASRRRGRLLDGVAAEDDERHQQQEDAERRWHGQQVARVAVGGRKDVEAEREVGA